MASKTFGPSLLGVFLLVFLIVPYLMFFVIFVIFSLLIAVGTISDMSIIMVLRRHTVGAVVRNTSLTL